MLFHLPFSIPPSSVFLHPTDKVLLCGSCFTEHIGAKMEQYKFQTFVNPFGTLFHPNAIAKNLMQSLENKAISEGELFYFNEVWNHWAMHSKLSHLNKSQALNSMNMALQQTHYWLRQATFLVVTFGSAYQYSLLPNVYPLGNLDAEFNVANCHKAPGNWFRKTLSSVVDMEEMWSECIIALQQVNPKLNIVFTVSPVRHIKDGLAQNNRSKGRLIDAAHNLCEKFSHCTYFPAYELVVDVLRDYRFYNADMLHPSEQAVTFVWDHFVQTFMNDFTQDYLSKLGKLQQLMNHKSRFEQTEAHAKLQAHIRQQLAQLHQEYHWLRNMPE